MIEKSIFKDGANKNLTHPKNKNGITLIALIITIIVLLILAGVTISTLTGEKSIITKSIDLKEKQKIADDKEKINLALGEYKIVSLEPDALSIDDFFTTFDWCDSATIMEKKLKIVMINNNEYEIDLETDEITEIKDSSDSVEMATSEDFFVIDEYNGEVTIKEDISENHDGIGYYYNLIDGEERKLLSEENIVIPSKINGVEVNSIRGYVQYEKAGGFFRAYNLKSVQIPSTVDNIGALAFYQCYNLEKVILPNNLEVIPDQAFYNCNKLTNITFPEQLKYINHGAFSYCISLIDVVIPSNVKYISSEAFGGCSGIKTLEINGDTNISSGAFGGCFSLEKITINGDAIINSLAGLSKLNTLIINGNATIKTSAFGGCTSLEKIEINGTSVVIEDVAFAGDSKIEEVILNGVVSVGNQAFAGCSSLTTITIPKDLTNIASNAFDGCTNLTEIVLDLETTLEVPNNKWGATNAVIRYE